MIWCRSHGRLWGVAVLLALTLQIALSFGHEHSFNTHFAPAAALAGTGGSASPPSPADGTHQHDENYCAIYAILALLTGAQSAHAPTVAPPAVPIPADIVFASEARRVCSSRTPYRSRAPPQS